MLAAEGRHEMFHRHPYPIFSLLFSLYLPTILLALFLLRQTAEFFAKYRRDLRVVAYAVFGSGWVCVLVYRSFQFASVLDMFPSWVRLTLPRVTYLSSLASLLFVICAKQTRQRSESALRSSVVAAFASLLPTLLLILGPQSPFPLLFLALQCGLLLHVCATSPSSFFPAVALLWALFAWQYFFVTGHRCDLPSVQYEAGYYGFEEFSFATSVPLVFLNTFASFFLLTLVLPLLPLVHTSMNRKLSKSLSFFQCIVYYLFYFALSTTASTLVAFLNRRHLMVWRIFAPTFLFYLLALSVCDTLILILFACFHSVFQMLERNQALRE
jgi:hypothetical protein